MLLCSLRLSTKPRLALLDRPTTMPLPVTVNTFALPATPIVTFELAATMTFELPLNKAVALAVVAKLKLPVPSVIKL